MAPTLGELAQRFKPGLPDLELAGDPATRIDGVCALSPGEPGKLAYLSNPKLREQLGMTQAAAVIITPRDAPHCRVPALVTRDAQLAFARIATVFDTYDAFTPGVHRTAVIAAGVTIPASTHVGAGSVVQEGVVLGEGVRIGPHCVIGAGARIGDGGKLEGHVFVGARVQVGKRVRLAAGTVLGSRGFSLARGPAGWEEVPQLGSVVLGDDVEVGANTTIDRGALGDTVIEDGVKIDNQVQIAHNCRIGKHTAIAALVGIAGSTRVGARCIIAGAAALTGHIEVCDDVVITGMAMVTKSITEKGQYGSGYPAQPARKWRREVAAVRHLADIMERVRALERRAGIEGGQDDGGDEGGESDV